MLVAINIMGKVPHYMSLSYNPNQVDKSQTTLYNAAASRSQPGAYLCNMHTCVICEPGD